MRRRYRTPKLTLVVALCALLWGCGGNEDLVSSETPLTPVDPITPPSDSVPGPPTPQDPVPPPDSVPVPPPDPQDSVPPPVDSVTPPPPDTTGPSEPVEPMPAIDHDGMLYGVFNLPVKLYGPRNKGTMRAIPPELLMPELVAARRASVRVILRLAGGERFYQKSDLSFDMEKWKKRIDRFRHLNLDPYIEDGTLAGHFILDEPHDRSNWGGNYVSRPDVDEMARYSKQIWPKMPTIVRGWPAYLKGYSYKYLDAAWAQYSERFGDIDTFIEENVRDSRASGLELVVGLNLLDGGTKASGITGMAKGRWAMSASQIRAWGGALMAEPYACAFISWRYNVAYFGRSDIHAALDELAQKAEKRAKKSCTR